MKEQQIQIFIDSAVRYFELIPNGEVKIGTPYLVDNTDPLAFDFTGLIAVTGPLHGTVYFSAPRVLLKHLLMTQGESDLSDSNLIDLAGELANTISGNARAEFGKEFMISVPVIIEGVPNMIHLPPHLRSYVIPIYWKAYSAAIVICVESKHG